MIDFSDPSYGSVDWAVIIAFLLFVVAGSGLLYRALTHFFFGRWESGDLSISR